MEHFITFFTNQQSTQTQKKALNKQKEQISLWDLINGTINIPSPTNVPLKKKVTHFCTPNEAEIKTLITKYALAEKAQKLRAFESEELTKYTTPDNYYTFRVPKKTGGFRTIEAPNTELKTLLTNLKNILENCCLVHNAAHAYVKGHSTVSAIQTHQKNESNWFLKLDFHDFFGSHNLDFIVKQFTKVFPFSIMSLSEYPETYVNFHKVLRLAIKNNKLPQGTPISPLITNICMVPIDQHISNTLAKWKNFVYTRYADDVLISAKNKFNAAKIVTMIKEIIQSTPLRLNEAKTRFGSRQGQNWNLGLMLNQENNITLGHHKKERFRASIANACTKPILPAEANKLLGVISYFEAVEKNWTKSILERYGRKYNTPIKAYLKHIMNATLNT